MAQFDTKDVDISEDTLREWQRIVDLMADLADVPAGLIMRVRPPCIQVFRASEDPENPYEAGEEDELAGLYCEEVLRSGDELVVEDALGSERWQDNPDIDLGMVAYYGLPLRWPDGDMFGTICLLDSEKNPFVGSVRAMMTAFRNVVETHLELIHQRRVAETERDRKEAILDVTGDILLVLDGEGRVQQISDPGCRLLGLEKSEVVGKSWVDNFVPEPSRNRIEEVFQEVLAGENEGELSHTNRVLTADGRERLIRWHSGLVSDGKKEASVVASGSDITARREAEKEIERLNTLLQAVRHINQLIVQETNLQQLMQKAAEALIDARGYQHCGVALLDEEAWRILPVAGAGGDGEPEFSISPDGRGEAPGCVTEVLDSGRMVVRIPREACRGCSHGNPDAQQCRITVPMIREGDIVGLLHVHRASAEEPDEQERLLLDEVAQDLGFAREKLKGEERLRTSERRFRTIFEMSPETIVLLDENGIVVETNEKITDWLAFEREEILNRPLEQLPHVQQEGRQRLREKFERRKRGEEVPPYEVDLVDKQGEEHVGLVHGRLLHTAEGEIRDLVMISDITERKRAQRELEKANRTLEETLKELREAREQVIEQERRRALTVMASGIAHDFNNALSTIRGYTDLLLESPQLLEDKEQVERYLHLIDRGVANATETVRRMRKFYQPREEARKESVNVNELVNEAVKMTEPRWKAETRAAGTPVQVERDLDHVPPVEGNAAELHEMLTNLIFNAVDAMPEGGTLTFRTREQAKRTVLEVSDTGTGMSEDVLRQCQEPFYSTKGGGRLGTWAVDGQECGGKT